MKKVLQVGMTENIGGMETYLMEQYRRLDRDKVRYDFVNITGDRPMVYREEIERRGDRVYEVTRRSKNPLCHYWDWCCLLWQVRGQYDILTLNACHLSYVFPLVAAKFFGIGHRVMHSHNSSDELTMSLLRRLLVAFNRLLMLLFATDFFACSEKAGKWMFGNRQFTVIHNAVDTQKFSFSASKREEVRRALGLQGELVIGHVGRFSYQKNHVFLIRAFAQLVKLRPDSVLLLVGTALPGNEEFLEAARLETEKLGLTEQVRFLGLREDVNELMQAMDVFLMPSRFEGLPLVGIEAQSAGLPCVFADTISDELKLTELANFVSLEAPLDVWADFMLKARKDSRQSHSAMLAAAGYDVQAEAEKVERLYLSMGV